MKILMMVRLKNFMLMGRPPRDGEVDVGSAPSVGQLGPEAPPRLGAAAAANTPVLPPSLACLLASLHNAPSSLLVARTHSLKLACSSQVELCTPYTKSACNGVATSVPWCTHAKSET